MALLQGLRFLVPSALLEVSLWVINLMIAVSNFLGVSFDGVERQAIDLFMALEREISLSGSDKETQRWNREMWGLRSTFKERSGGSKRFSPWHGL